MPLIRVTWDMPSSYKRTPGSRKYRDFSNKTLNDAIRDIKINKLSFREAQDKYNIPKSTLQRKIQNKNMKKVGGQTILTMEEENILCNAITLCSDWGFPLESGDIKNLVQGYLNNSGKQVKAWKNNRPGVNWYYGFIDRHKDLTIRLSENIKRYRAAVSRDMLNLYYDRLEETLKDIPPENILNYDESGFTDDPGKSKVVVRKNARHAERIMDHSKTNTSVMFCVAGNGIMLPPYIVYKSEHIWSTWTERGPENARYNRSKSGWFDQNLFEDWFLSITLPYMKKLNGPKVLLGDNLASHISIKVIKECEENNIKFVLLPPNSTHLCQPLDVSCFRPIKGAWRKLLKAWRERHKGPLRKDIFPNLLKKCLEKVQSTNAENIKSGFAACGIIPLDRNAVLKKIPGQDLQPAEEAMTTMASTLKGIFQENRFGKTNENEDTKTKKRKLNVQPGQSVSLKDLNSTTTKATEQAIKSNKKVEKKVEEIIGECSKNILEEETGNSSNTNIEIDDYVLVKLRTVKGSHKYYVGQVIQINPYYCSFMKKSSKIKNCFYFPDIVDGGIVEEDEIQIKLSLPQKNRRGALLFKEKVLETFL